MAKVRVIIEYLDEERIAHDALGAASRRAREKPAGPASGRRCAQRQAHMTFELLGRASEVAQREQSSEFQHSLAAFFREH